MSSSKYFENEEKSLQLKDLDESRQNEPRENNEMSGAEALIKGLEEEDVSVIFGVIGGAIMPVYDELGNSDKIKHITMAHEQGAAHAADGYARVTGKPGVCFATSGPGASNLITGIATAYMDSSPVVSFTGQVPTDLIGRDSFQEVDVRGMTDAVTKHNYLIRRPENLPKAVHESFELSKTGRPGPVLIDLPKDVQTSSFIPGGEEPGIAPEGYEVNGKVKDRELKELVKAIDSSSRPLILAGGGVSASKAGFQLRKFARKLKIPVTVSLMGLGTFPAGDPLFLGMLGMHGTGVANKAVSNTDLLIAIGTRLDDRMTGKVEEFASKAKIAHIDIDPSELGKIIPPDISLTADANDLLTKLNIVFSEREGPGTSSWVSKVSKWRNNLQLPEPSRKGPLQSKEVIDALDDLMEENSVVTTGVGQHQMWVAQRIGFDSERSLVTSGGLGTMGYGFPSAIGAKFGAPDKQVVCVTGDGSFQMNIQELSTAIREKLDITVVILRNGYLGMVRQWQELFFDDRMVETRLSEDGMPSFAKVARAYGWHTQTVEKRDELNKSLKKALKHTSGPSLVECYVEKEENVFPMVPPGSSNQEFIMEASNVRG